MSGRGGRHPDWPIDRKVYVGGLSPRTSRYEIEDAFRSYGRVENCWVARQPPGFAFLLFEDDRDAEDACRGMNGRTIAGRRVRVEMSHGLKRKRFGRSRSRSRSPRRGRSRSRSRGRRRSPSRSPRRDSKDRDSPVKNGDNRSRSRSKSASRSRSRS